jgi:hypothetical protein
VPERAFTDEELDAAVQRLSEPGRLDAAQDLVLRAAPSLQRMLASALAEGGWFDSGHGQAVSDAIAEPDPESQLRAVRTLLAEETRLGMLVGVAIGFELSHTLDATEPPQED